MSDEMINKTKPYNRSSGLQGIGDTVKAMNEHDMNVMNDPIGNDSTEHGKHGLVKKINKNS
jgi:hypothetical protein